MELKRGKLLQNGKYRIEGVLGQGGFGITYLAVQVGLNRKVAVKEFYMKEHCNRDADTSFVSVPSVGSRELVEGFKNKFVKEAQNIASFNHNNIIRIHDIFEENGTAYYVMEYHDCGSLLDYVTRKGRLSEEEAMFFIRQIADALAYIHELKINHLDIKPGNILLDKKNNAILIDFGLSKHYDEVGGQTTSSPVGRSKGYAPMEQYKQGGVSQFSPSTDIYSLGATMYKLVTGETPAEADEIYEDGLSFPADVVLSDSVRKAIEFAMQPKRKDRPQSIEEFLRSFEVAACSKGQSDEATVIDVVDNDSVDEETVFETKEQEQERKAEEEIKRRVEEERKRREEEEIKRRVEEELKRREEEKKRKDEQEQERKRKETEEEYQLGEEYYKKGDYPEAVKWFRKSAEQGHAAAQNWLGSCYKRGQGVTQDYSESVKWFRKSAEQGNTDAQNNLGFCYQYGQGVTQDYSEAVKWYRKSAEQGNAVAQDNLGSCYYYGDGVTKDYSEAVKWYRKSAEQGDAHAQINLALCYEEGKGVTQDYSEAVKWYRKSAEQGNVFAQKCLALCYEQGQGVTQDYSEAVKWYRKSAEQGDVFAQYTLGFYYDKGQGVTQDYSEAMKWYKKAADNGHQDAKDKVEEMTKLIAAKVQERKRREEERKRRVEEELKRMAEEERKRKNRMKWIIAGVFVLCFFIVPVVYRNVHENKAAKEYDRLIREGDRQLSLDNFSESIAKYNEAKELEDKYKKKRNNPSNFNNNAKDKLDSAKKKEDEYNERVRKQELAQEMLELVNGAKWRREDFKKAGYEDLYDALNKYEFAKVIEYSKDIPASQSSSWESIIKFCKNHTKENIKGPYSKDGSITIEIWKKHVDKFLKETAKASQFKDRTFEVKGVKFKMIAVKGGTFNMGAQSTDPSGTNYDGDAWSNDEKPVHSVTLSDYYIGETEVTQELWEAVMGSNPSEFSGNPQRPVERVTWLDCKEFITKLNKLTGKNFRLPTEAEWEYAARGGNKSKGYKYSGSNTIGDVAWYDDNSGTWYDGNRGTHNVKTKSPNELGIYDMSGNVWEWCKDWYGDYSSGSQTNPAGPSTGSGRVQRGGSWNSYRCRVSERSCSTSNTMSNFYGFRLALSQ